MRISLKLLRPAARGMLLEEAFAAAASRTAHQRERPPDDMRQHQIGDRQVVVDQFALGDALRLRTARGRDG